jgi:hypothetical protein
MEEESEIRERTSEIMRKVARRTGKLYEKYDVKPEEIPVVVDKILFCLHSFSGLNAIGENENEPSAEAMPLNRMQSSHSTTVLPFPHRVQMVKQIRGILLLHQENFFAKISQILYLRYSELIQSKPDFTNKNNLIKTNIKTGFKIVKSKDL